MEKIPKKVLALGNCQAQMIEGMLAAGLKDGVVERFPPVFEMAEDDREHVVRALESADCIFVQRTSPDYPLDWLRPDWLRERFGEKLLIWPNIYFDGYFPDVRYLYLETGKLQGPLDDYHFDRILSSYKAGLSLEEATSAFLCPEQHRDEAAFQKSLSNLEAREKDVDVTISDFLVQEVSKRRCFFTPNHPHNFVLVEMTRRLVELSGLRFDVRSANRFPYALDNIYISAHPAILQHHNLGFDLEGESIGRAILNASGSIVQLGERRTYQVDELVKAYYEVYNTALRERRVYAPPSSPTAPTKEAGIVVPSSSVPSHSRRIGLVGYYGFGNYGDELFKEALTALIPDSSVYVIDVPRLKSDDSYREDFLSNTDAVIIGGGDLIIPSGWAEWYFSQILLAKRVFVFGVGVPTWAGVDEQAVAKMSEFFAHPNVRMFAVRDVESAEWVEANLALAVPLNVFPDIVCGLEFPDVPMKYEKILTLITREQHPGEIRWENIKALCSRAEELGYRIRNLILGTGETAKQDIGILNREASTIDWEIIQRSDNRSITSAIAELTVVASMKFHGCVAAAMLGIPAIGLSTTDKFTSFFKRIERLDLRAHHSHSDLAERLPKFVVPVPQSTIRDLREGARVGFEALRARLVAELTLPS